MIMLKEEIVRSYCEAKKKKAQINILAARNRVTPREIQELLLAEGVLQAGEKPLSLPQKVRPLVSPEPLLSNRSLEKAYLLLALVEKGASIEAIAEALEITFAQTMTLVAMLCTYCENYIAQAEKKGAVP